MLQIAITFVIVFPVSVIFTTLFVFREWVMNEHFQGTIVICSIKSSYWEINNKQMTS